MITRLSCYCGILSWSALTFKLIMHGDLWMLVFFAILTASLGGIIKTIRPAIDVLREEVIKDAKA